mmetsp:Transcript_24476/g.66807  ORF Transcript_24476/g.66807 Transcript_24476/m.66807 type:complete len:236 (-) Transcript_24476:791-1498(-)
MWARRLSRAAATPPRPSAAPRPVQARRPVVMAAAASQKRPIVLLDIMDTVCTDPFFQAMPAHFGMSFKELLAAKHPTAWVDFECNRISEEHLCQIFFKDGRPVDRGALRAMMHSTYQYLDGMEPLLARLAGSGYEMHALSNYPCWFEIIEEKLQLSRYLSWTFMSCTGPMEGFRKPDPQAFSRVLDHLGVPPDQVIFVDDRQPNVDAAAALGMPSLLFKDANNMQAQLQERGLEF